MRSSMVIALVLLAIVLAGGTFMALRAAEVSEMFTDAAQDLRSFVLAGQWEEAVRRLTAYRLAWEELLPGLQMQIDHEATDDVTLALEHIAAGLESQNLPLALLGCRNLRESASHLHHRDAFTWANIL